MARRRKGFAWNGPTPTRPGARDLKALKVRPMGEFSAAELAALRAKAEAYVAAPAVARRRADDDLDEPDPPGRSRVRRSPGRPRLSPREAAPKAPTTRRTRRTPQADRRPRARRHARPRPEPCHPDQP